MGIETLALSLVLNVVSKLPRSIRERMIPDLLIPTIVNDPSKVQLDRLGHIYFEHPDLAKFEEFAKDFGFVLAKREKGRLFFRGYGKDPFIYVATESASGKAAFKGPAFVAASKEEFEKAKALPGAQHKPLGDAPGGGEIVTFARADDTLFHVIYGQTERDINTTEIPTATTEELGPANKPFEKLRKGKFHRFHDGPA